METSARELAVRTDIAQMYRSYAQALEARDAPTLAAHYSDDAVVLVPGVDLIAGAQAVRAYCEGLCSLPYRFRLNGFTLEHLLVDGVYAIEVSRYAAVTTPLQREGGTVRQTKSLLVWRKAGEKWLIVREMYSDVRA